MLFLREWYMHPNGQMPGLRVRLRRRESAGARLGLLARLQDDRRRAASATALFLARVLPEAADQLHLVGQSQGRAGQATSSPAASSGSTTSASSIARKPLPDRRPPGAGRRHRLDGVLLRDDARRWRWNSPRDDPAYEDIASKFFEHFVAIADAMNTLGGTGLWDEEDGFYYDQLHVDGRTMPLRDPLDGRHHSALRGRGARGGRSSSGCPASRSGWSGSSSTGRTWAGTSPIAASWTAARGTATGCWPSRRASGWSACCATCSTKTNSSRRTASGRCRAITATSRISCPRRRRGASRRLRAGRIDHRPVRRQLQLARPDLVPRQLPAHRSAGALSPLLRRRVCRSSARPAPGR